MHVEPSSLQRLQFPKMISSPARPSRRSTTQPEARGLQRTSARTRLLKLGTHALSDVELLSLILRSGKRLSAHDLGADLLTAYGSLRALLVADQHRARMHGLTTVNYAALQAALEIARRHYQELMMTGPALKAPQITREFFHMRMRDLPYEVFAVLYLDKHDRVIQFKELFRGTIDSASVHVREVVKDALAHNAAAAIIAHNHPSGLAEPSQADELITRRLKEALALVDIRLIDHLIVGDGCIESFAERGLL